MNRKPAGQAFSASVFRLARCACCILAVLFLAAAPALGEGLSWEERLEQARAKYNEQTVNVYMLGRGSRKKDRINVRFYHSEIKWKDINFCILESLQITDEAEMQAILEVVAGNDMFSEEEYGTISFIKAEWITHNLAYGMANGTSEQKTLVTTVAGQKLSTVIGRAEVLDVSPLRNTSEKETSVYEFIEAVYCHK